MPRRLLCVAACVMAVSLFLSGRAIVIKGLHGYQQSIAPLMALAGVKCRFTPTCSRYAEVVLLRDGLLAGSWKTARRIVRCGPWTAMGTVDDP